MQKGVPSQRHTQLESKILLPSAARFVIEIKQHEFCMATHIHVRDTFALCTRNSLFSRTSQAALATAA